MVRNLTNVDARLDATAVDRVAPVIKARFPGWDNDKWIVPALRVFFAEATGQAPKLPPQ